VEIFYYSLALLGFKATIPFAAAPGKINNSSLELSSFNPRDRVIRVRGGAYNRLLSDLGIGY
jgi:hypothetical protein